MTHFALRAVCVPCISAALCIPLVLTARPAERRPPHPRPATVVEYVANKGQWPAAVRFKADVGDASLFLLNDGVRWVQRQAGALEELHHLQQAPLTMDRTPDVRGHAWTVTFVGALPTAAMEPAAERPHYYNYFIGPEQNAWAGGVRAYERIVQRGLWPGVDVIWHGQAGQVKYDIHLAPGTDVSTVALAYEGLDRLSVDARGDLHLATSVGIITEQRPKAWYADTEEPLACHYTLQGDTVLFAFPDGRDPRRAVVIDPVIYAATYSGTAANDRTYGVCAAYDHLGNIYGAGQAHDNGFPNTNGAFQTNNAGLEDVVINKFTPDGTELIWATYLGGPNREMPISLVVDSTQQVALLGASRGAGYPTTPDAHQPTFGGGYSDIVVTRLNASGSALIGSTYLGGTGQDGTGDFGFQAVGYEWYRGDVLVDVEQRIWLVSVSHSSDLPTTPGAYQPAFGGATDAVICCLGPACDTLLKSTYFGGLSYDNATTLQLAPNGDLLVGGSSASTDLPIPTEGYRPAYQGGARDGYLARFDPDLSTLTAGTYFGTGGRDAVCFLDQDPEGNIFVLGVTDSLLTIEPPGTYGQAQGRVFIARLDTMLTTAPLITTIGPSTLPRRFSPSAFTVDDCGRIHLAGYEAQPGFTCTNDSLHGYGYLTDQFYLAAFEPDMAGPIFGSYYGGYHADGGMSRFDGSGVLYLAICCYDDDLDPTPGAFDDTNPADFDLGLLKLCMWDTPCGIALQAPDVRPAGPLVHPFPDPTSDRLNIPFTGLGSGPIAISIHDASGRTVLALDAWRTEALDVSGLAPGMYVFRITDGQAVVGHGRFMRS